MTKTSARCSWNTKLTLTQGILPTHQVPAVLVARVVFNRLLHRLGQERGQVYKAIHVSVRHIVVPCVERLASNAVARHHLNALAEISVAVDGGGDPLETRSLVEEELVVDVVLDRVEGLEEGSDRIRNSRSSRTNGRLQMKKVNFT